MKNEEANNIPPEPVSRPANDEGEGTGEKLPDGTVYMDKESGVLTTQEEMDAYNIVRSILREHIDAARITYKDYKSYFVVNLDNSEWWWICRIFIGARSKWIGIPSVEYKNNERIQIDSIDDIFKYADKLKQGLDVAVSAYKYWKEKKGTTD